MSALRWWAACERCVNTLTTAERRTRTFHSHRSRLCQPTLVLSHCRLGGNYRHLPSEASRRRPVTRAADHVAPTWRDMAPFFWSSSSSSSSSEFWVGDMEGALRHCPTVTPLISTSGQCTFQVDKTSLSVSPGNSATSTTGK